MELEYFEYLVNLTVTTEQRFFLSQLGKNTTNSPNVHSQTILLLAQQYFRSSVPKGFNLVGQGFDRQTESSCQSKVSNFECSCPINEQILRFEVAVNDSASMAVVDAIAELIKEEFDLISGHSMLVLAKVFLHIVVHKLKDQVEFFFSWDVDNFFESI